MSSDDGIGKNPVQAGSMDVQETDAEREGIEALLSGFRPEQVPPLAKARELETAYPFLHALVGRNLRDFLIRVAALEAIVADGRSPLKSSEIAEPLYWLKESPRDSVLRVLRGSGWLTYEADSGYRITPAGRFVDTVLSFLRARLHEGSLLPTVEGIDYMLRLGVDPLKQVLLLRSQLEDLRTKMETARSSHSEVILRGSASQLREALDLSERIRTVLAHVPLEMADARRAAQDVHDLLSRLHGVSSDLHAAVTEIGRQYLHLVAGLTTADIITTLMRLSVEDLAAIGRQALRPVISPPPLVVPELLAAEAELYLTRRREPPPKIEWADPPEAEKVDAEISLPLDVMVFLDDLDRLAQDGHSEPLSSIVPRGTAGESYLRASLLPLLGGRTGGEGVAGRLGALPLTVTVTGDGFPVPAPAPLAALSPGKVGPPETELPDG